MTRFALIVAAAAALGSAAHADQSDRYNDLRFNTAVGHIDCTRSSGAMTQSERFVTQRAETSALSSSSARQNQRAGFYAYSNRFGVGPYNDSR